MNSRYKAGGNVLDEFLRFYIFEFMDNLARKRMTVEEYFAFEESSLEKYEFYQGEIYAMSGATRVHNLVVGNILTSLKIQFKKRPCEVYPSDMRVQIDAYSHYTYPDLTLVCGKRIFKEEKELTLLNPTAIVEVLSGSTESYDRGKKFQAYRNIPSLQTYILVSTTYKQIEVFSRVGNHSWVLSEPDGEGIVFVPSVECSLSIQEVYDGIEIEEWNSNPFIS
jgi:Uma2 family endonuclease